MNRLLLLAAALYGLLLVGLATLNGEMLALALPVALYLAAALIYAPAAPRLTVSRILSTERVQPDGTVDVCLHIANAGSYLEEVLVEDKLPAGLQVVEGETRSIVHLPPGKTVELVYTVTAPRGQYQFERAAATAGDHLGLFRRQIPVAAPGSFTVLPLLRRMPQIAIRPRRTRASSGAVPARVGGPGLAFFGVREYQPGDSLRWINWRAAARHPRHLFTNEFEQERVADVGLILDARVRSDIRARGESLFEHAVTATASLADAFLRGGNRVALLVYGGGIEWVFPGYGRIQRERILQALGRASRGVSDVFETFESLPTRLFPPQSQIVVVSPLWTEDLPMLFTLRAHQYELLVVSPNPVAFEQTGAPANLTVDLAVRAARLERTLLIRRLRQAGAQVVDWQVDAPLDRTVLAGLGRTPQWTRSLR